MNGKRKINRSEVNMKMKWLVVVMLGMSLTVVRAASAAAEPEHKEGEVKIPATVGGIWAEVKEHEVQLGKMIAGGKFDKVHEVAFKIRDLVNALPEKSKDLPADKLAKVKADAKYVADIAKRLDESGDAGDKVATEDNFKKLQRLLKTTKSLYEQGATKRREKLGEKKND